MCQALVNGQLFKVEGAETISQVGSGGVCASPIEQAEVTKGSCPGCSKELHVINMQQ